MTPLKTNKSFHAVGFTACELVVGKLFRAVYSVDRYNGTFRVFMKKSKKLLAGSSAGTFSKLVKRMAGIGILMLLTFLQLNSISAEKSSSLFLHQGLTDDFSEIQPGDFDLELPAKYLQSDYREAPPLRAGQNLWLATTKGVWQVLCKGVSVVDSPEAGLKLTLHSEKMITGTYYVLYTRSFPKQTWNQKVIGNRIIIMSEKGTFRISSILIGEGAGECLPEYTIKVDRQGIDKKWHRTSSFRAVSPVAQALIDVDGDGIPEIVSEEEDGMVLRRFWPKMQEITRFSFQQQNY